MNGGELDQIIADEDAVERQYRLAVNERERRRRRGQTQRTLNTLTTPNVSDGPELQSELIGRVALRQPSADLDGSQDFYIGTDHLQKDGYSVFSWTAPVACTFYRKSSGHHPLCDEVAGVRVLVHRAGRVIDAQDEAVGTFDGNLFPRKQLQVPRAPGPSRIGEAQHLAGPVDRRDSGLDSSSPEAYLATKPDKASGLPGKPIFPAKVSGTQLRVRGLLERQLAAPKARSMSAVLATLQPDQYEAITRPQSQHQVIEGHPGTGKTIIAVHRAAFLLLRGADDPSEQLPPGRVLILGPTSDYVQHVRGALQSLVGDDSGYEVVDLPSLIDQLAALPISEASADSRDWRSADLQLAEYVDIAYSRALSAREGKGIPTAADVYSELCWLPEDLPSGVMEKEWFEFLKALPPDIRELRKRRLSDSRRLLAYIGIRVEPRRNPAHVIIDEAQDLTRIDWQILGRLGNRGGWTILGDLNQRRNDFTYSSWDHPAKTLGVEADDGRAPLTKLIHGYRSTLQIIRFADQLLPARERSLASVQQDGEAPTVERTRPGEVMDRSYEAALTFLSRWGGTRSVAIISMTATTHLTSVMRRRGWIADSGDLTTWRSAGRVLRVLPPERARGLEFDAVVVEPADFPENVGRSGVLYTALTRANRALTVVHSRPLPRGMKSRP